MSMSAYHQDKITIPMPAELAEGGDAKAFRVGISGITMANGERITPPRVGVTVIVGGNNVGKSTFLRDLWTKLSRPSHSVYKSRLIESLDLIREGRESDMFAWFMNNVPWSERNSRPGFLNERGAVTRVSEIRRFCDQGPSPKTFSEIADHVVQRGDLHNRIGVVSPVDQRKDLQDPPKHPIHRIQDDPDSLERIQALGRRIFRQDLTLDRLGGKTQLRVGIPDVAPPKVDRITPEYTRSVAQLETLEQQGDGMRSLLGLLLPLVTGHYPIMLIDEPEAFLHPPQAKIVGRVLGELAVERETQIFLATHDRNMLVGLLEAEAPVTVVRLDRNDNRTVAHQLDHHSVRELWNEPVLRYSNVLDGLFHRAVVLTESDRDCRFYAASLDNAKKLPFAAGDVQFIPAGGKDGFARLVKALRSVSVPLVVVADLDVLNDQRRTQVFVEMLGGDWSDMKGDYKSATQQFRTPRTPKTRAQVLELVRKMLQEEPTKPYDKATEGVIQAAIRAERSPWQDLKDYGTRAFKGGVAVTASLRMLDKLEALGGVLVREGELERLAPGVHSRKGPEWITEALQVQAHTDSRAQEHIVHVVRAIEGQLSA